MKPILRTENLNMRFGGLWAVQNLSLEVYPGELVGLIGPNGAGKTTCFNMFTGVYQPSEGNVYFEDQPIDGLAPNVIARLGLARTFQNIRLFRSMTVLENVLVALHPYRNYHLFDGIFRTSAYKKGEAAIRSEALAYLTAVGLEDRIDLVAASLPYGDQRRLEIARALATKPKLLLLDEPAAGMNPSETAQLSKDIEALRKTFNVTVLLIEHDMSLVMSICERIYVLDYGQRIAHGRPDEIRKNPKVIEAYLGGGIDAHR